VNVTVICYFCSQILLLRHIFKGFISYQQIVILSHILVTRHNHILRLLCLLPCTDNVQHRCSVRRLHCHRPTCDLSQYSTVHIVLSYYCDFSFDCFRMVRTNTSIEILTRKLPWFCNSYQPHPQTHLLPVFVLNNEMKITNRAKRHMTLCWRLSELPNPVDSCTPFCIMISLFFPNVNTRFNACYEWQENMTSVKVHFKHVI